MAKERFFGLFSKKWGFVNLTFSLKYIFNRFVTTLKYAKIIFFYTKLTTSESSQKSILERSSFNRPLLFC